jgi:hypothetical protein
VSVFLVNRRPPRPDERRDAAFAFQAQLDIHGDRPFVPRPDLRSLESDDWDERVADLQYRDAFEFAVGHSVATAAIVSDGHACWTVRTCWIPEAEVERVAPSQIDGVELSMDALGLLTDAADAHTRLGALVTQYRAWIEAQRSHIPAEPAKRRETAEELLHRATVAARRIEHGVQLLADPVVLEAFRLANRAMATAARRRQQLSVISSQLSEGKQKAVQPPLTTDNRQPTTDNSPSLAPLPVGVFAPNRRYAGMENRIKKGIESPWGGITLCLSRCGYTAWLFCILPGFPPV